MTKKTLCLNMIVKDESHIIEETLTHLCEKFDFDYWVISDTGSTDNTMELINKFFEKKNIKGEIHCDLWKDFGYNRTMALKHAHNKSDYLLIFDADDRIEGDIKMDLNNCKDGYWFKVGHPQGFTYHRLCIVNNRKLWFYKYKLHETIQALLTDQNDNRELEMLSGNYWLNSRRLGSRSKDPLKYYKDGQNLEKYIFDSLLNKNDEYQRYMYYCGQSYKDANMPEKAIEWFKKTIDMKEGDVSEKFISCVWIYECYKALDKESEGLGFLYKSLEYDFDRFDAWAKIMQYYQTRNKHNMVMNVYNMVKDLHINQYNNDHYKNKLFYNNMDHNFLFPHVVSISAWYEKNYDLGKKCFENIFTRKGISAPNTIKLMLENFSFYIKLLKPEDKLIKLYFEYVDNLGLMGMDIRLIVDVLYKNKLLIHALNKKPNLMIYTGPCDKQWNYNDIESSLGGSETSAGTVGQLLSDKYNVFVVGEVKEEIINKGSRNESMYIHGNHIGKLAENIEFDTIIVSRYLDILNLTDKIKFKKLYLWAHDFAFGSHPNQDAKLLLEKYDDKIAGCVCLTEWHKNLFAEMYPSLKDKISVINNCIPTHKFAKKHNKVKNQFLYTSRSERGLLKLLEKWEKLDIEGATLKIASYKKFPDGSELDSKIEEYIKKYPNVSHVGCLNKQELYNLMSESEYWFYPCAYRETSCISAMEMMKSQVYCIYYDLAGLTDTMGPNGLKVNDENDIEKIKEVVEMNKKKELEAAEKYVNMKFSLETKKTEWLNLLK